MSSKANEGCLPPRISHAGSCALLLDVGCGRFSLPTQQRLWALTAADGAMRSLPWVREMVLGVNNLLVIFDPMTVDCAEVRDQLQQLWLSCQPLDQGGTTHEVIVDYDLSGIGDVADIAANAGLSVQKVVDLHCTAEYRVACVGSMPGFAYLVGLPDQLATPRRASPRAAMPKGAVIIGGTQAGIMPCTAPSGWHMLGTTGMEIFDPHRERPSLFMPGDRVIFKTCAGVSS